MKARILKKMLPKPELPDRLIKDRLDTGQVVQLFRPDNTFWHQKTKTIFFVMKIDGSAIKINGYRYDKDTEQIVPGVQVSPNVIHRDGKDYLVCEDNSFLPVEELQALDNTSLDAIATYNIVVIHYLMLLLKKL